MGTTDHILFKTAAISPGVLYRLIRFIAGLAEMAARSVAYAVRLFTSLLRMVIHMLRLPALLILTGLFLGSTVFAQEYTDKRSVNRSFPASRETTLEIQNKYGKVQVVTWDRDSVSVTVDMFLTESSASKLRKLKDDVHIDITGTHTYILVKTIIDSESGRLASELKSVTHTIAGSNKRVEVNYMVRVPRYLDVVIQNKFGDIFMDDLDGRVDIDLSNGVLKAHHLEGNSAISLSFANGMINALGSATMNVSYTDLTLGSANQLDVESRSSEIRLERANVVKINSRRDRYHLQEVEYLYGNGDFTQVWIYDFIRESDLYMKYGELTIGHILPGFNRIYVQSDYTDVSLSFDPGCSFSFDILHNEKAVLRLPAEHMTSQEKYDGKSHFQTSGRAGEGEPAGVLKMDALQKCYLNISFK